MKKLIVIGATGSPARYVIEEVQKLETCELMLFARKKSRFPAGSIANANVIEGDVLDYPKLKEAIAGQDIVLHKPGW